MSGFRAKEYFVVAMLLSWAATLSAQSVNITEYPVPTANSDPALITQGPDGALWFTEGLGNKIARVSTSGAITEYPNICNCTVFAGSPYGITAGSDGALWFTDFDAIGRITVGEGKVVAYG